MSKTLRLSLDSQEVLALLVIAATSALDPKHTSPELMAMVYKAKTVIDTSPEGSVNVRAFDLSVRA